MRVPAPDAELPVHQYQNSCPDVAEICQQTLSFLLLTQTLFQLLKRIRNG